ncbi:unnamed protein product [Owenia fusiformis]|uniref:Uncharacterized protein n=1 Tax=Owenia fusiformis TaxID=6347 RepID=A0A8J1XTW6_OWEFU|nr:unnamed protein product [Owenia fusiformis]
MNVDKALSSLGRYSRWQMFYMVFLGVFSCLPDAWSILGIVFIGATPEHYCKPHPGRNITESSPYELRDGAFVPSQCQMYANGTNSTVPCMYGWEYGDEFESTIVTDWDLVCGKAVYVQTSAVIFSLGIVVGAILFTSLADKIGRKPVYFGCAWMMAVIGISRSFSQNYTTFAILSFFIGMFEQGADVAAFVLAQELFPGDQRTMAASIICCFWAISVALLAPVAYLVRNWRYLQLVLVIPSVLTIPMYWFTPESITWLVANGRIEEAIDTLKKAAKFNNIKLPDAVLTASVYNINNNDPESDEKETLSKLMMEDEIVEHKTVDAVNAMEKSTPFQRLKLWLGWRKQLNSTSVLDLLKHPKMILYSGIMAFLWFVNTVTYYGLALSTNNLSGNRFVNFFIGGIVELPAYLFIMFLLHILGRRHPLFLFHILAGLALIASPFIPKGLGGLSTALVMIGKLAISSSFGILWIYAPEIYPTNFRNIGLGFASASGRIAGILAPYTGYVDTLIPWFSGVTFGVAALISAFLGILLPETLNRPLPMTFDEVVAWKRSLSKEEKQKLKWKCCSGDNERNSTNVTEQEELNNL